MNPRQSLNLLKVEGFQQFTWSNKQCSKEHKHKTKTLLLVFSVLIHGTLKIFRCLLKCVAQKMHRSVDYGFFLLLSR